MFAELLNSKKFIAMIGGLVVWAVGYVGLDVTLEAVLVPIGTIVAYILAQGAADVGKSAAKIQVDPSQARR